MKTNFLFSALTLFAFLLFSCQHRSENASAPQVEMLSKTVAETTQNDEELLDQEEPPSPPKQPAEPLQNAGNQSVKPEPTVQRQIIKTANYRIQVKDVNASSIRANAGALRVGGYVSESEMTNSSYEITNRLTIRVPAARFDSLLEELGGEAIFTQYKKISAQDVTEEYVDITTRLRTKKEVRDRYVEILRNKAKTVKDILDAEEQIRVIQEEIEAKEGRLRYLKDQVAMSTIFLELYQSIEYRPEPSAFHESFLSKLQSSLKGGWEMAQGIVLFFVNIWPLLLLFGLFWWKRRWVWAKIRRKEL
jgi:hypothetical protein